MSRRGVSGSMFLLVPAHPGRPGQRVVKRSCVCVCMYERILTVLVIIISSYIMEYVNYTGADV